MKSYITPKKGTYYFKVSNFNGTFKQFYTSVEVLAETEKSYQIQLSVSIPKRHAGDKIWVHKRNVDIEKEIKQIDVTDLWYNNH